MIQIQAPSIRRLVNAGIVGMAGLTMLSACSTHQEDPRVSFCRSLAVNLSQSSSEMVWQSQGHDIVRPEYAAIKLVSGDQQAVCYYAYDAVEESALDHIDELDAYATLPYQMTLNGEPVAAQTLTEAIKTEQIAAAKAIPGKAQEGFGQLLHKIKQLF